MCGNISTKEQISKENILNVGCENILFQKSKIKRELFVLITIILLPYQLRNLSKLNVSKRQSKNVLCPILNLFNFRKSRHNRSKDDKIPQTWHAGCRVKVTTHRAKLSLRESFRMYIHTRTWLEFTKFEVYLEFRPSCSIIQTIIEKNLA